MLRCPERANPEKQQRNKKCRETDAGGRVDDRRRCCGRTRADGVMHAARLPDNAPRPSIPPRRRQLACRMHGDSNSLSLSPSPLTPDE